VARGGTSCKTTLPAPTFKEPIWARSVKERVRFRAILVLEFVAHLGDTVRC
jgi:hypothetical protein